MAPGSTSEAELGPWKRKDPPLSIRATRAGTLLVPGVAGMSSKQAAHAYLDAGLMPHPWRVKLIGKDRTKASAYYWFSFGNPDVYNPDSPTGGSHPKRGCTVTHDLIERWRASWRCGLAVCRPSGLFAIDVDDIAAFEAWETGWGWPRTAKSVTGRAEGGYHLLYDGRGLGQDWPRQGNLIPVADDPDKFIGQIKSNGFIAVEPSLHPYGNAYRWVSPKVAPAGSLGRSLCRWQASQNGHAASRGGRAGLIRAASSSAPGLQHDSLRDYAADLAQIGLVEEEAMVLLRHMSGKLKLERGRGAWRDEDLSVLFKSAAKKTIGNARGAEARELESLAEWEPVRTESAEELAFWDSRPVLAHIRNWARARRAAPWATLGECLAEAICHTPSTFQLPGLIGGPGTPNMLIAMVGGSGMGKRAAYQAARDAFRWEGIIGVIEDRIPRLPVGSGEGISRTFGYMGKDEAKNAVLVRTAESAIITITEIDTFKAISERSGSTISSELRKLYSGEDLGFNNASPDRRVIIPEHGYRGVVIAGVQPGRGEIILGDIEGGFAQRWLWLSAIDYGVPDERPAEPEAWDWSPPDSAWEKFIMKACSAAAETVDKARVSALRGQGESIESHSLYTRLKVAAGLALLESRDSIGEEDWELSGYIMMVSARTRDSVAAYLRAQAHKENIARGRAEGVRKSVSDATASGRDKARIRKNVLDKLKGRDWTSTSWLKNKTAFRDRELLPEVLQELVKSKVIELRKQDYKGQPGTQIRKVDGRRKKDVQG